ncbi:MAG: ABC transporter permease, partial [Chloroflexi bacterium]|nr:ABC transporter permease [Chloroflexota bacterium]
MPIRTGLPGAVVQRSLADWPVVLAAWLLLVCATTLLATGVVYGDAVASGGLHRALLAAPPRDRTLEVGLSTLPGSLDGLDRLIRPEIERAMAATGGDVVRVVRSGSFADPAIPAADVTELTQFQSLDGLESRTTLVAGAWPRAGAEPVEATVSDAAAAAMGLAVGDRLSLVSRLDTTLTNAVVISGIWRAGPDEAVLLGDELLTTGTTIAGPYTTRGPLVIREADLLAIGGARQTRIEVSWRGLPAIESLRVDGVDALRNGAADLAARLRGTIPANASARVSTGLPTLLDDVGRSVLVSRSGVILLTIQFAVLAGYAVVLVAGMLIERRRSEIALMRSRGASSFHLIAMAVLEAAFLAVPAAILAPFLAVGVVALLGAFGPTAGLGLTDSAQIGQSAIVVAAAAGLACIVALTVPTLTVAASPAGARAAQGRQARTTLAQRLGLDLALVAVAAVALWQLRLYGAPLTQNARGSLGLDPLLVAAPAIGLVGGAVLALRVVPRIAELGERLLVRGRGLVGSLGGRQLARRPLRYTRAALLLMLAAALG